MTFCRSNEEILSLCHKSERWNNVLHEAKAALDQMISAPHDTHKVQSGWGHNFTCEKCASQLKFNPYDKFCPGSTYICPNCGAEFSGGKYDEAWVYCYRFHYASNLINVALLAKLGDEKALTFIINYMDYYACNYESFPLHGIHGEHSSGGKIMEQALDEAVFAINVITALNACGEKIPEDKKDYWYDAIFLPMVKTIVPQTKRIHNHELWIYCAAGVIGCYFNRKELLDFALNSEYGIVNQVKKGYTSSGFWYEGSITYHYYATEAFTYFMHFYGVNCAEEFVSALGKAYTAPAALSYDGVSLPSINDGWYPLTSATFARQLTIAQRILWGTQYCKNVSGQVACIYGREPDNFYTVCGLLFGIDDAAESGCESEHISDTALLCNNRIASIRKPLFLILKSGVLAQSHMHLDAMSIIIPPFSNDLGTPGYGCRLNGDYYRSTIAHNTVLCDFSSQEKSVRASEISVSGSTLTAKMDEYYPGVSTMRIIRAEGNSLVDTFSLRSDNAHTYTWLFHGEGVLTEISDGCLSPVHCSSIEESAFAENISKYENGCSMSIAYENRGMRLTLTVSASSLGSEPINAEIFTADIPGNPATKKLRTVLYRVIGKNVEFQASYNIQ